MVARADDLAHARSPREARTLYQKVIRQHPGTPAAADALYGLAQLLVQPESPLRDYSAAHATLGRLLAEYPESPHASEARAWHAALGELLRSQADARQVREDLERLKQLDMEQERRR
jgi:outer membrane protein assembly factor BamD (BamD/ComL family)